MSQLIACQNGHGIVLATDGKAVDFNPQGKMIDLKVDRLVQISQHTAILTGGAADGVEMCHSLRNFLKEERLNDIEEVYGAALPFLSTEFERFMRKRCEILPVDPSTMSILFWVAMRLRTPSVRFACTSSGRRRSFHNSMATRSLTPTRPLGSLVWSTS